MNSDTLIKFRIESICDHDPLVRSRIEPMSDSDPFVKFLLESVPRNADGGNS